MAGESTDAGPDRTPPPAIPLMLFPHESNLLISADIARITASPVYQQILADWVQREWGERLQQLKDVCAIDLLSDVGRVLSAHTFDDQFEHRDGQHMLSIQGLTRTSVRRCTRALTERKLAHGFVEDGPFAKVDTSSGPRWHVWLGEDTAVVPSQMTREQLGARMDAADNLHNNVAMAELANLVERDAVLWGILRVPPGTVGAGGVQFHSVYGWVHLGRGLDMRIGFRHPDVESARKNTAELARLIDQLVSQAGDMGKYFDGLEVGSQGSDMILTLTLDEARLNGFLREHGAILRTTLLP